MTKDSQWSEEEAAAAAYRLIGSTAGRRELVAAGVLAPLVAQLSGNGDRKLEGLPRQRWKPCPEMLTVRQCWSDRGQFHN